MSRAGQVDGYVCSRCGAEVDLREAVLERRPRPEVIEVFLRCTACGAEAHVHFESDDLRGRLEGVNEALARYRQGRTQAAWQEYRTRLSGYQREFDAFNHRWRRKLKLYEEAASAREGETHGLGV